MIGIYLKYPLYIFCFFPFVFPINALGTDIQFYAFIISLIYIVKPIIYFSREIKVFFVYALLAAVIGLLSADNVITYIRCLFQYASLFTITLAMYNLLIRDNGIDEKLCKIFILTWFIVGLIQTFIYPDFLKSIVSNSRTTLDRGVGSLASEPSFYGIQCFYFMFIVDMFVQQKKLFWGLIFLMALLFAQSFTGIFFLLITCILLTVDRITIRNIPLRWIVFILSVLPFFIYTTINYFESTRLGMLVSMLSSDQTVFIEDESSAVRFRAITGALQTSWEAAFLPIGFSDRVGSMFGGILQELGMLGIPLMVVITYIFTIFFDKKIAKHIVFVTLFVLLFTNMQLANPTLAFIMAIGAFQKRKRNLQVVFSNQKS